MSGVNEQENVADDVASWILWDDLEFKPFSYDHRNAQPGQSEFEFDRHPDDDLLLQQLDQDHVPWYKHLHLSNDDIQLAVKNGVAMTLWRDPLWGEFQKLSKASDNYKFYHSVIRAAATLVYSLYTQELLFGLGDRFCILRSQLNDLWVDFAELGKQGLSTLDVVKKIVSCKIDKDKYSLVTEGELAEMIVVYKQKLKYGVFQHPYQVPFPEKEKDTIFDDIKGVVDKMEPSLISKADDYTRLLIKILRRDPRDEDKTLIDPVMKIIDTAAMPDPQLHCNFKVDELSCEDINLFMERVLMNLIPRVKDEMMAQLDFVKVPLFALCDPLDLELSSEIFEIIEVAELRRVALGSRFISQKHLMWAFYECGYGLPPEIMKVIKFNSVDEDHPPYHIYLAFILFAVVFGYKRMELKHFVFAVLHWKDIEDENKVYARLLHFRDFVEELETIKSSCVWEKSSFDLLETKADIPNDEHKEILKKRKLDGSSV